MVRPGAGLAVLRLLPGVDLDWLEAWLGRRRVDLLDRGLSLVLLRHLDVRDLRVELRQLRQRGRRRSGVVFGGLGRLLGAGTIKAGWLRGVGVGAGRTLTTTWAVVVLPDVS